MGALVKTEQPDPAAPRDEAQYLTFVLGEEMFAMDILGIKEIIQYGHVTGVPMMPTFVRGVINLRGAVVPVVDLAARFGRPVAKVTRRSCIVILETRSEQGAQDVGVLVDAVSAVLTIPAAEIEPPPSFGGGIRADFIGGMAKVEGRFVIVLNVDRVLSVEEMALLSRGGDPGEAAS
ncbi:chemotaxis protein CheW [Zobellella aerophila]|uniref:Chemotaxis protein CheW n=1 Tax=Zobellella aerophila TaxID=870480 RepID=A0ABP6VUM2_9GAMM